MPRKPKTHPFGGIWPRLRLRILERDAHRCQINGPNCTHVATDVDHIVSWQAGGAWHDPANLRASCVPCNRGRTKYLPVHTTPADQPSRDWYATDGGDMQTRTPPPGP